MKAYLVNFSVTTRVLSDETNKDKLVDELSKKAREQILKAPDTYLYGDNMEFEEDEEMPFDTEYDILGYQVTGTQKDYLWDGDHADLPYIPSWIVFNKEDAERLVEYAHDRNWKDASLDEIFNGDIEDPTFAKVDNFI